MITSNDKSKATNPMSLEKNELRLMLAASLGAGLVPMLLKDANGKSFSPDLVAFGASLCLDLAQSLISENEKFDATRERQIGMNVVMAAPYGGPAVPAEPAAAKTDKATRKGDTRSAQQRQRQEELIAQGLSARAASLSDGNLLTGGKTPTPETEEEDIL